MAREQRRRRILEALATDSYDGVARRFRIDRSTAFRMANPRQP